MAKIKRWAWCIKTFLLCILGFGTIEDSGICWFSKNFYDVHDYKLSQGGTGVPSHMYEYMCPKCRHLFSI